MVNLLGLAQVGLQWALFTLLYVLPLLFRRRMEFCSSRKGPKLTPLISLCLALLCFACSVGVAPVQLPAVPRLLPFSPQARTRPRPPPSPFGDQLEFKRRWAEEIYDSAVEDFRWAGCDGGGSFVRPLPPPLFSPPLPDFLEFLKLTLARRLDGAQLGFSSGRVRFAEEE